MRAPVPHRLRCLLVTGMLAALALAGAAPAGAAVTCTFASGTVTITTDENVIVSRSATDILVNASPCAPLAGTTQVVVTGVVSGAPLAIDQSAGTFGPIVFDLSGLTLVGDSGLVVMGTPGPDSIVAGNAGIDLDGDGDSDVVLPTAPVAQIVLVGQGGDDFLSTTGGNGTGGAAAGQRFFLSGGPGADTIDATDGEIGPGSGGDLLDGGPGDDVLSGDNADAVFLVGAPSGGTIDIGAGTAVTGDGSDTFSGIANVFATQFDDVVFGDAGSNVIFAFGGNDVVHAGGAQDTVDGGEGNDQLFAETGADFLTGGPGDDLLSQIFQNGFESDLSGGPGDDTYQVAFGSAAGKIAVSEAPGEGNDEIVVSCNPEGSIVSTPGAPGSGTISRGGETATYVVVELVTIPAACVRGGGGGGGGPPPPATPARGPHAGAERAWRRGSAALRVRRRGRPARRLGPPRRER